MSQDKTEAGGLAVMALVAAVVFAFCSWWWFTGHDAFAYKWSSDAWRIGNAWAAAVFAGLMVVMALVAADPTPRALVGSGIRLG